VSVGREGEKKLQRWGENFPRIILQLAGPFVEHPQTVTLALNRAGEGNLDRNASQSKDRRRFLRNSTVSKASMSLKSRKGEGDLCTQRKST